MNEDLTETTGTIEERLGAQTEGVIEPQEEVKTETETPADSSTEIKAEKVEPSQQGENTDAENIPFHKHPRWKKMVEDNSKLRADNEDLKTFRTQVEPIIKQVSSKTEAAKVPDWFSQAYGDDPSLFSKFQAYDKENREQIKKEIMDDLKKSEDESKQAETKWNEWVDTQVTTLAESETFDRNQLMKFMVDYQKEYGSLPQDSKGNIDFAKSLSLMNKINAQNTDEAKLEEKKKATAKASTKSSNVDQKDTQTLDSLRGKKSWRDF